MLSSKDQEGLNLEQDPFEFTAELLHHLLGDFADHHPSSSRLAAEALKTGNAANTSGASQASGDSGITIDFPSEAD